MMKSIILAASLVAAVFGHGHPGWVAKATINIGGATGYVKVAGGVVNVSLDLRNFNFTLSPGINMTRCRSGINYHIHVGSVGASAAGGGCAASIAGGHFDPTFACGGATDKKECANKGGCITRSYACSTANFMSNPLIGCEVGDWSGKYGSLMPANATSWMFSGSSLSAMSTPSPFEISSTELYKTGSVKSVVFHCGSPRLLCADFAPDTTSANMSESAHLPGLSGAITGGTRLVADFGSIGGPLIEFGGQQMQLSGNGVSTGLSSWSACTSSNPMSMTIGATAWGASAPNVQSGGACNASLPINDPTYGCVSGTSQTTVCKSNYRCYNTTNWPLNYATATAASPYYVSQGAMFTTIPSLNMTVDMRYLDMSSTALLNKPVVLRCGTSQWCAKIIAGPVSYTPATPTPAPTSDAKRPMMAVAGAATLVALMVHAL